MKKTIKLTESDLKNVVKRVVKENKSKRKIYEANEHLIEKVDDLENELMIIISTMESFIENYTNLVDEIDYTHEDDAIVDRMAEYDYYVDKFNIIMDQQ